MLEMHWGIRELFRLFSQVSFTAQPPKQTGWNLPPKPLHDKAATPQKCKHQETGRNTFNLNPFAMRKQGCKTQKEGDCVLQQSKFQSLLLLSSAKHQPQTLSSSQADQLRLFPWAGKSLASSLAQHGGEWDPSRG